MTTAAVDTAVKIADWVAALRSGEFQQGRNALRQPAYPEVDAYCCLGVACDLSGVGEWHVDPNGVANAFYLSAGEKGHDGTLPPTVAEVYSLASNDGNFCVTGRWLDSLIREYPDTGRKVAAYLGVCESDITPYSVDVMSLLSLATLNDGGLTFAEVADVIESQPPGLFDLYGQPAEVDEVDWVD